METRLLNIVFLITVLLFFGFTPSGKKTMPLKQTQTLPGISQLVETRNGKTSCWGIIIQLEKMTFNDSIDQDQITIADGKYRRDMKPIMMWTLDKQKKQLTIKFKPGMGGFGTGDDVTVEIKGYAFVTNPEEGYIFQISTDIL